METYINQGEPTEVIGGGQEVSKVLIATIFNPEPVLLASTRLGPDVLVLLVSEDLAPEQKKALDVIRGSLGKVLEVKEVKIPEYDIAGIAKEVVKVIDMQRKTDVIYVNITSGRKTQAIGVLLGAYARSSLVKKIAYNPEEKGPPIYLPILSFKLHDSQKNILITLEKKKVLAYSDLSKETGLSSAMIYRHIDELKDMDLVEITDEGIKLTDAGRIARL